MALLLWLAGVPGEAPTASHMLPGTVSDGIEKGLIGPDTTVTEATSGNTGHGMAAGAARLDCVSYR